MNRVTEIEWDSGGGLEKLAIVGASIIENLAQMLLDSRSAEVRPEGIAAVAMEIEERAQEMQECLMKFKDAVEG